MRTPAFHERPHRPLALPRPVGLSKPPSNALAPQASDSARPAFADAWQSWVQAIVTEQADDPARIEPAA